jgi:hypothetical protein
MHPKAGLDTKAKKKFTPPLDSSPGHPANGIILYLLLLLLSSSSSQYYVQN